MATREISLGSEPFVSAAGRDGGLVERCREGDPEAFAEDGEGSFFLETVVARDGWVSAVTLLEGDSRQARTIVDALRQERFEPASLHGRRVAVSVYRLISRLEVRAPLT